MVSTRVMTEPKDLQVGQSRQMGHFLQVANLVLPDVDLLQLCAVGEVLKRADFVVRQRHNFEVWQVAKHTQVVYLKETQVDVLEL